LTEEDKLFKSPEEKKREEKFAEEKEEKKADAGAKGGADGEKAKKAVDTLAKKEAAVAKEEAAKKKKEKEEKKEKKREIVLQRVFVVPLDEAYFKPRSARARVATRMLQAFIAKHMKTPLANVRIAPALNSLLRERGDRKPPKKVRVSASKDKDGIALAEPAK
jgi:large subunit ribosomal protein L31e